MHALLALTQPRPLVHAGIEWLAYFLGARAYWRNVRRQPAGLPPDVRGVILAVTIFGAAMGAVALHACENLSWTLEQPLARGISGKSVLGGLLGGTLGTELAKRCLGIVRSTGDAWVTPLVIGLVVGRIGCQLSGTWDATYGSPTGSAWGWDYGDGIPRYPTAFVEILAVLVLWALLGRRSWPAQGRKFNAFLLGYCLLRFVLEFFKPPFGASAADAPAGIDRYAGLTAIQWTALAGAAWMAWRLRRPAGGS